MSKMYGVFEDNRKWEENASLECGEWIEIPDEVMGRKVYRSKESAEKALKEIVEKLGCGERRTFLCG